MTKIFRTVCTGCVLVWVVALYSSAIVGQSSLAATEAPAGFDNLTNGFVDQPSFDIARGIFEEHETIADGLGPVFNADSCGSCHGNPVTGAISQVTELRAGHFNGITFVPQIGGSLINDRAIDASIQERVFGSSEVRTFRTSLNTLGDGFVEAIADSTLVSIADSQPASMRGLVIRVPVVEALDPNVTAVGRFGWKNQHASLLSFSADAYLNEMGITTTFFPEENTSNGRSVAQFDTVADPEDTDGDVFEFAAFIRATKVPPRDASASSFDARVGSQLFDLIGCNICHVRTITTAPPGTPILGGFATVSDALGNKIIHPFSDFLLHNVGTGDGIVQNGPASTRNRMRTPPLWGMRSRDRLMHDGDSLTRNAAILRHAGEATGVINNYRALPTSQKNQLVAFLNSL